jgi:hypothetical protein
MTSAYNLKVTYTNYRGETSEREILPTDIQFKPTEWHPEPQWILGAYDFLKSAHREFALRDMLIPTKPVEELQAKLALAEKTVKLQIKLIDEAEARASKAWRQRETAQEQLGDIRALLWEARHNGLIYWEPQTARGHEMKALMLAKIDKMMEKPDGEICIDKTV